jgi:para-nitrobenzyl esterase
MMAFAGEARLIHVKGVRERRAHGRKTNAREVQRMPGHRIPATAAAAIALALSAPLLCAQQEKARKPAAGKAPVPVTVKTFARAESDLYFGRTVQQGGFGKFVHSRAPTPIDRQDVIRMNRDTLYSSAVFDLDAGPVTLVLPDPGKRFMSLLVIDQDHYNLPVVYAPGSYTFTRAKAGTRYLAAVVRTLADPNDRFDLRTAHALQDAIQVRQAAKGSFEVPDWDPASQRKVRDALLVLAGMSGATTEKRFGAKGEVDPVQHLLYTAAGWGGNPVEAAVYTAVFPKANDGRTVHRVKVKGVPVDGFWSISVYNADGYFEKNALESYSLNNLTAKPNMDGSVTVQFGGCTKATPNCLVTPAGWSYVVRLYRPRKEVLDGSWRFPEATAVR